MNKIKIKFAQFELLHETSTGTLVSGFSSAISSSMGGLVKEDTNTKCTVNNCHAGNCTTGCSGTGSGL